MQAQEPPHGLEGIGLVSEAKCWGRLRDKNASLYIKQIWSKRLAEHHTRTGGFQKAQIEDEFRVSVFSELFFYSVYQVSAIWTILC